MQYKQPHLEYQFKYLVGVKTGEVTHLNFDTEDGSGSLIKTRYMRRGERDLVSWISNISSDIGYPSNT